MGHKRSPWLLLFRPKEAASVVAGNPKRGLWMLAWLYGFLSLLSIFQEAVALPPFGLLGILTISFLLGPLWGMLQFWIVSLLTFWTGKLLQGKATFLQIRAAFAWSFIPMIFNLFLWVVLLFFFGIALFQKFPQSYLLQPWELALFYLILLARVASIIWFLIIFIHALAEVQQFSVVRSVLNIVFMGVLFFLFLFLLRTGLVITMHLPLLPTVLAHLREAY